MKNTKKKPNVLVHKNTYVYLLPNYLYSINENDPCNTFPCEILTFRLFFSTHATKSSLDLS